MKLAIPNNGNIYLCGFMGSGKSTVGPILARELGLSFVDTDRWVSVLAGKKIPEIFDGGGEEAFRKLEHQSIEQIARLKAHVVALGGGSLVNPASRKIIRESGVMIYLKGSLTNLLGRIVATDRPMLKNLDGEELTEHLSTLLKAREPFYDEAQLVIDTDGKSTGEVVREMIQKVSLWKR